MGNLSRSIVCDIIRQIWTQYMLPPASLPHSLASYKYIAHLKIKNKDLNMLKYFSQPLCGLFILLAAFKMFWNGSRKCIRGLLTSLSVACKQGRALGNTQSCHTYQIFAAFALAFQRSWGLDSWWYDSLFLIKHVCSVFLPYFRQQNSSYWKGEKKQNISINYKYKFI